MLRLVVCALVLWFCTSILVFICIVDPMPFSDLSLVLDTWNCSGLVGCSFLLLAVGFLLLAVGFLLLVVGFLLATRLPPVMGCSTLWNNSEEYDFARAVLQHIRARFLKALCHSSGCSMILDPYLQSRCRIGDWVAQVVLQAPSHHLGCDKGGLSGDPGIILVDSGVLWRLVGPAGVDGERTVNGR